jgi:hypothetical protein
MNIVADNPIRILCSRCGVALDASSVAAVGSGVVKLLHKDCSEAEYQFVIAGQARVLTLTAFLDEFQAALGIPDNP